GAAQARPQRSREGRADRSADDLGAHRSTELRAVQTAGRSGGGCGVAQALPRPLGERAWALSHVYSVGRGSPAAAGGGKTLERDAGRRGSADSRSAARPAHACRNLNAGGADESVEQSTQSAGGAVPVAGPALASGRGRDPR